MSILRPPLPRKPPEPTQKMLKRAIDKYGIRRRTAARFMGVSGVQLDRYCLPTTSKQHRRIPPLRWEILLIRLKAMHHPQEEVDL